jgi:steroid 5-alpha reductase family enzyme
VIEALFLLAANLILSALFFLALWGVSIAIRDPSFVDAWWALGVIALAWSSYLQPDVPTPHGLLLAVLATAWALRLGLYLLWRWRKHGHDRRYAKMFENAKRKLGWGFATTSLLFVFLPQMLLQIIVALPVQISQIGDDPRPFGALGLFGAALAVFGILYEALADAQLARFKADPSNASKVMDRGLWRYSRHPNYFGELCTWWGLYAIACETPYGAWSFPGPLLLTLLLTRVSGAPTTEPHLQKTRPDYEAYKRRTSGFIPLPPKAS